MALLWLAVAVLAACDGSPPLFGPETQVGDRAPASRNRIMGNQVKWSDVCTMNTTDRLHKWQIANLLKQGRPFILVFGTPQHCTLCVDQIIRVAMLQEKYGDKFAFVHVDGYRDNPVWVQWGVKGEPWTFLVNSQGYVEEVIPGQMEMKLIEKKVKHLIRG